MSLARMLPNLLRWLCLPAILIGCAAAPPTPQTVVTPQTTPGTAPYTLTLEPVVSGLIKPLFATHAGDGSGRLFVVEQPGRVRIIDGGALIDQPFLDIVEQVSSAETERGLLGLAFDPDYAHNGQFYVSYTRKPDGADVIARYQRSTDPNTADTGSETVILVVPKPQPNHNGGMIAFGRDGFLYAGYGDGGGAGDLHGSIGSGQDIGVLLGKLLRLNVRGVPTYTIPTGNPFASVSGAQAEVWAYGLRNPWRFSFDRANGDLYIGDVGQDKIEEIDVQPAGSHGGENYGWRIYEGTQCYTVADGCGKPGLTSPVAQYDHSHGCAVTGGYVYRGTRYVGLQGVYLFADYCSGIIWSLARKSSIWHVDQLLKTDLAITSFGEDQAGELYVVDQKGTLYHIALSARQ